MGDFNIDLLKSSSNHVLDFVNLTNCFGLRNLINKPTRVTKETHTLLDHIVKVKLNLNTLLEWSCKKSRVPEILLEEVWRKGHGSDLTATQVQHYKTMNKVTVT